MKTKLLSAISFISFFAVTTTGSAFAACEPGVWDIASEEYQGRGLYADARATSTRLCLADGALQADEYRTLGEDGEPIFWGISLQPVIEGPGETRILWLMVGDPGYTLLPLTINEDGSHSTNGNGSDMHGPFRERSETTFDEAGNYHFVMERSYNGGRRWIQPFNTIDATLTDRQPGPAPAELAPIIAEVTGVIPEGVQRGTPILDGAAEIRTFERNGRLVVQFASRYWNPDRWRVVEWVAGTTNIDIDEFER